MTALVPFPGFFVTGVGLGAASLDRPVDSAAIAHAGFSSQPTTSSSKAVASAGQRERVSGRPWPRWLSAYSQTAGNACARGLIYYEPHGNNLWIDGVPLYSEETIQAREHIHALGWAIGWTWLYANCTGSLTGSSLEFFVAAFYALLDPVTDAEYFAAMDAGQTITDTESPMPVRGC